MKFQTIYNIKGFLEPGILSNMLTSLLAKEKINKLTIDQVAKIPLIYGSLEPGINISEIDDSDIFETEAGTILGKDLKALNFIIYAFKRADYVLFDKQSGPQYRNPQAGPGTPWALLGWRNLQGIPYDTWKLGPDNFKTTKEGFMKPTNDEVIKKVWQLDQFLGYSLASTRINLETGMIEWGVAPGLVVISALDPKEYTASVRDINYLREQGTYSNQSFAAGAGAKEVSTALDEDYYNLKYIRLYNRSNTIMKLMLAQRWLWYGNHRSSDMICDFRDWDNIPKSVDDMSTSFKGIAPKITNKEESHKGLSHFGL